MARGTAASTDVSASASSCDAFSAFSAEIKAHTE